MVRKKANSGLAADVYLVRTESLGVSLRLGRTILDDVEVADGELRGPDVVVAAGCVLVQADPDGELHGIPMEPIAATGGTLTFDPSAGGVRTRENRRAAGAHNEQIADATRFGMVNALYHFGLAAERLNGLLRELGSAPLPLLKAVVGAHPGSQLPGFGQGDGDFRRGHMLPFSGGHYRLSQITSGVPEHFPIAPSGEVHLGPGRRRQPFAGHASYLTSAAHNPATIYHEFAHHLCRHTADFRLNGERRPPVQRNGKLAMEEGFCDYFAASMLETGRPYGWFRPGLGARRDPENARGWIEECATDAHAEGALWASGLWRCRQILQEDGLLEPRAHDRVVVAALLEVGSIGTRDGRRRRERQAERCAPSTVISAYLSALREAGGPAASDRARRSFRALGPSGLGEQREGTPAC